MHTPLESREVLLRSEDSGVLVKIIQKVFVIIYTGPNAEDEEVDRCICFVDEESRACAELVADTAEGAD